MNTHHPAGSPERTSRKFKQGDPVWFPHEEDGYRAGLYETAKPNTVYDCQLNRVISLTSGMPALQARSEGYSIGSHDMSNMGELTDASILWNLMSRYRRDQIYTNIGSILIAMNPYRFVSATLNEKTPGILRQVCKIYDDMLEKKQSHSVIVTGESGAGKTESVRLFINQLATLSIRRMNQNNTTNNSAEAFRNQHVLQERIIQAGPILESFGNAKTVRNSNSSRFGKWIEVEIDYATGQPISANIRNYLLEKSRIVRLGPGERNFHIFYQMLVDPQVCEKFGLENNVKLYRLLQGSAMNHTDDASSLCELRNAMNIVGMQAHEIDFVFRVLSGILFLGNVTFQSKDDKPQLAMDTPAHQETYSKACRLLKINCDELQKVLLFRTFGAEKILVPRTEEECKTNMDALIKYIYQTLFQWITERINVSLDGIADVIESSTVVIQDVETHCERLVESGTIGILDAFGFEIFQTNSFEQLCINYCNEKMQLHFNRVVFEREITEYNKEGILDAAEAQDLSTSRHCSISSCIDLLEQGKGFGIFSIIDDELKMNGTDQTLFRKLVKKHKDHRNFSSPAVSTDKFTIKHYAGEVEYSITGFLQKSADPIDTHLKLLCADSTCPFLQAAILSMQESTEEVQAGRKQNMTKQTLGTQFRDQLSYLTNLLFEEATPTFIRCIKPNDNQEPKLWNGKRVLEQIRYAGLLEASRVRARGFPVRYKLADFMSRFKLLTLETVESSIGPFCTHLEKRELLQPGKYRIGKTKVFLQEKQFHRLETLRHEVILDKVQIVQAALRGWYTRYRVSQLLELENKLRDVVPQLETARRELVSISWPRTISVPVERLLGYVDQRIADLDRATLLEKELQTCMVQKHEWGKFCLVLSKCEEFNQRSKTIDEAQQIKARFVDTRTVMEEIRGKVNALESSSSTTLDDIKWLQSSMTAATCLAESTTTKDNLMPWEETQLVKLKAILATGNELCQELTKQICATRIQRFFHSLLQRKRARSQLTNLYNTIEALNLAVSERKEKDISTNITRMHDLGFGDHHSVKDASPVLAQVKIEILASLNQLERMTKKLNRKLDYRTRRGEQRPEHQQQKKKRKKKRGVVKRFLNLRSFFNGDSEKKRLGKNEYELFTQAIDRVKAYNVDAGETPVMQEALKLAARFEKLQQQSKRGSAMRMFSSSSLLSRNSSSDAFDYDEEEDRDDDGEEYRESESGDIPVNTINPVMIPLDDESTIPEVDEEELMLKEMEEEGDGDDAVTPDPESKDDPAQQHQDDAFVAPTIIVYPPSPIAADVHEIPASAQRALIDRVCREKEMRRVINCRYWEMPRITGKLKHDAINNYNKALAENQVDDYSFSSLYSDLTDQNSSTSDSSNRTLPEQQQPLHQRRPSLTSSVGSQPSLGYSLKAYTEYWESIAFVERNVVCTKTF